MQQTWMFISTDAYSYLPTVHLNIDKEKLISMYFTIQSVKTTVPFVSRNVAKFERRCNAILQTACIWMVNSSMIQLPAAPPIPSLDDSSDEDFTTPRSCIVSLT